MIVGGVPLLLAGGKQKSDSGFISPILSSAVNSTVHTYTGAAIGFADPGRVLVIVTEHYSSSPSTTGVTVGGVAATLAVQNISSSALGEVSIWYVAYPEGETADIVITKGGSNSLNVTAVYALYGLVSTTPAATSQSDADPADLSLNVTADSFGVGMARAYSGTLTHSWVGATEDYDGVPVSLMSVSAASNLFTANESPRTITDTYSVSPSHYCAAFAVWS